MGLSQRDALRLKRNYGYAHKQARGKSFQEYQTAIMGALLHHGNDHSCCDASWCDYAAGKKDPKDNKTSVLIGTKKWKHLKEIHDKYTTADMLKMCHHLFDSQKNESLNQRMTTIAPKNKTFCTMMSLADCVFWVIIVDSIGYDAGLHRVLSKLTGCPTTQLSPTLHLWLRKKDDAATKKKQHQQKTETKKRRSSKIQAKIKESIAADRKAKKRNLDYGSGIAVNNEERAAMMTTTTPALATASKRYLLLFASVVVKLGIVECREKNANPIRNIWPVGNRKMMGITKIQPLRVGRRKIFKPCEQRTSVKSKKLTSQRQDSV